MKGKNKTMPRYLTVLGASVLLFGSLAWGADDQTDVDKRLDASAKVLTEIMGTPDKAIPDKVMRDAKCIAVIPSMVKIAVGFGGSHGKGVATCRTESGAWSAPAPITSPEAVGDCSWAVRPSTCNGRDERPGDAASAREQVQARRRRICRSGSGGP